MKWKFELTVFELIVPDLYMATETEKKEIPLKCTNKSSCYVFVCVDSGNNVTRKLDLVPLQQFF